VGFREEICIYYYMHKGWDVRAMMPTREYSGGRIHAGIQEAAIHSVESAGAWKT